MLKAPSRTFPGIIIALGLITGLLAGCTAEAELPQSGADREAVHEPAPAPVPEPEPEPEPAPEPPAEPAEPGFDRTQHSIDDPNSPWVVSNKLRPLDPIDWVPGDLVMPEGITSRNGQPLRAEAAASAATMLEAAEADGVWFLIGSAYRDYALQTSLYERYIQRDGQAAADTYSARPGHSEHQTGLAADFDDDGACYLDWCFGDTAAGVWLRENAAEHGWIMRYPEGYDHITGFMYEPWHYRYVGPDLALEMREQGILTLEEFFGLPEAPDYAG